MLALTLPYHTWAHQIPAGWKLLGLAIFTILLFPVTQSWLLAVACVAVVLGYLSLGRHAARYGISMLRPLVIFVVIIAIYHIVTRDYIAGVNVILRLCATLGLANLVTMTTRLDDMIALVKWLLTPFVRIGVNTDMIGMAIAMMIRFIPVLMAKAAVLSEAWQARSLRRANWRIIFPFCLLAIDDAEHISQALRARGGVSARAEPNRRE